MLQTIRPLATLLAVLFFVGCSGPNRSNTPTSAPAPSTGASVQGTIQVHFGAAPGDSVTGTIRIVLDTVAIIMPVNGVVGADSLVSVDYAFTGLEPGRVALVYIGTFSVNGRDTIVAGYAAVELVAGRTVIVPAGEISAIPVNLLLAAAGAARIDSFYAVDDSVTVPDVVVRGNITNLDLEQVFVYVNGNVFPVIVHPDYRGAAAFSRIVTLDAGENIIVLLAVNSGGITITSLPVRVYCNLKANDAAMLATLIWDTPTSDVDLHLWYYGNPWPNPAERADQHCYFGNDSILFDSTALSCRAKLDVDDIQGEGPEHITIANAPDGYYVFALNCYNLNQDLLARCDFTLSLNSGQKTISNTFTEGNRMNYVDGPAWLRCFDVRVFQGAATILDPDTAFVYQTSILFKALTEKYKK